MTTAQAQDLAQKLTVAKLEALLQKAASAYYHGATPVITDAEFDAMKDVLTERSPNNKFVAEVGAPVTKGRIELPFPMMSMDKVKPGEPSLARWLKKYPGPFSLSDKLDGTSCMLVADGRGKVKLYSRGDHRGGQDISHLVGHILPQVSAWRLSSAIAIRGEIVMDNETFRIKHASFANPRGLTNGLVNRKTVDRNIVQDTDFVAYEVVSPRLPKSEQWDLLASLGLKVVHHQVVDAITEIELADLYTERRANAKYDIDGIIVEDEGPHELAEARNPIYAFAFKMNFDEDSAQTTVIDVVWEASKDSRLIPRVQYSPVTIDGTILQWATGFNARFIEDNKIGPGSIIRVIRAGQVIPKIVQVVKHTVPKMPEIACSWDATRVHLVLQGTGGDQADTVTIKLILRFFTHLQIDNMKEGLVAKFYDAGFKTIHDYLVADTARFLQLPGVSHVLADKLVSNIQEHIKEVDLATLMTASNVFGTGMGERKLKALLKEIPTILDLPGQGLIQKICAVEGFQTKTAEKVAANLPAFKAFLKAHPQITVASEPASTSSSGPSAAGVDFTGQVIVFTGFRNKEWEKLVTNNGGKVVTSVSAKTTLLVAKDPTTHTGKVDAALQLNIPVISFAAFESRLSGS